MNALDIKTSRRFWRVIPDECHRQHRNLVSRVSLDENGPIVPIFKHGTCFGYSPAKGGPVFDKLDDAEVFAAGMIAERAGLI